MFYLGIVLATFGALLVIIGICLACTEDRPFLLLTVFGMILIIFSLECFMPSPKAEDAFNGKADYVTYTKYGITDNGDTISCEKTYRIVWKDEWKYGRKQK